MHCQNWTGGRCRNIVFRLSTLAALHHLLYTSEGDARRRLPVCIYGSHVVANDAGGPRVPSVRCSEHSADRRHFVAFSPRFQLTIIWNLLPASEKEHYHPTVPFCWPVLRDSNYYNYMLYFWRSSDNNVTMQVYYISAVTVLSRITQAN